LKQWKCLNPYLTHGNQFNEFDLHVDGTVWKAAKVNFAQIFGFENLRKYDKYKAHIYGFVLDWFPQCKVTAVIVLM
jgi:hypothetical protein